jgi:hypothetical protein
MMDVIREFSTFIDLNPLVNCQRKIVNRLIHLLRNPETETNIYLQQCACSMRKWHRSRKEKACLLHFLQILKTDHEQIAVHTQPKHNQGNPKRTKSPLGGNGHSSSKLFSISSKDLRVLADCDSAWESRRDNCARNWKAE